MKVLLTENLTVDAMGLGTFSGERTLSNILKCLSPDVNFNTIQMVLPFKVDAYSSEVSSLVQLNQMISDAINEESPEDLSMIFIDIKPLDLCRGIPNNCDFPNRVFANVVEKSSGATVDYVYQTVGAVYKATVDSEDKYAFRILSRARCGGKFYLQEYFYETKDEKTNDNPRLSYLRNDVDSNKLEIDHPSKKKEKNPISNSMFPAEIENRKKKYFMEGVILCLNEGQREGCKNFPPEKRIGAEWNSIQNAMSLLEPITSIDSYLIRLQEFLILEPFCKDFIVDELLVAAHTKFLKLVELQSNLMCFLTPMVIRALIENLYETNVENANTEVWNEIFKGGYEESRALWEYKNIFAAHKWYFAFVNYPNNLHWIFVGLHSGHRCFFIYDPKYSKDQDDFVTKTIQSYIDLEAETYASSENHDAFKSGQWQKIECRAQQQPDDYSCGVMVLIAFFRAIVLLNDDASVSPEMMAKTWSCITTNVRMREYRLQLSKLLSEGEVSASAFVFFSETLMGEVMSQNLDAQESKQQGGLRNRKSNN